MCRATLEVREQEWGQALTTQCVQFTGSKQLVAAGLAGLPMPWVPRGCWVLTPWTALCGGAPSFLGHEGLAPGGDGQGLNPVCTSSAL